MENVLLETERLFIKLPEAFDYDDEQTDIELSYALLPAYKMWLEVFKSDSA